MVTAIQPAGETTVRQTGRQGAATCQNIPRRMKNINAEGWVIEQLVPPKFLTPRPEQPPGDTADP